MKGTLCFCHRKGNSSVCGWVLVTKKRKERKGNFLKKDFSVFKPFSSRAAASFKSLSSRDLPHETMVVSGSSRSGPGAGTRVLKRDMIAGAVMTDSFDLPHDVEFSAFDATGENEKILALSEVSESAIAKVTGSAVANATTGESEGTIALLEVPEFVRAKVKGSAAAVARATAGGSKGTIDLLDVTESAIAKVNGAAAAAACALTGESKGTIDLLEVTESVIDEVNGSAAAAACAPTGATVGQCQRFLGFCESQNSSCSSGCLSVHACATLSSAPASAASSRVCPVSSSAAVSAAVVHVCSTPIHNSCSDTVSNSLLVQRCRKVRLSSTVGNRSVVQTVDMSPAPGCWNISTVCRQSA